MSPRYGGIQSRSSEIALQQGRIETGGSASTTLDITIGGSNIATLPGWSQQPVDLGRFTYEMEERTITYEGGGVFAGDEEGSISVRKPRVTCTVDTASPSTETKAVITLIRDDSGQDSFQSNDPVMVTMEEQSTWTHTLQASGDVDITLGGDNSFHGGWASALEDAGFDEQAGTTWRCDSPDTVIIRIVTVEISILAHQSPVNITRRPAWAASVSRRSARSATVPPASR
ncbi:MAG: hypothetical protein U5K37_06765 [Natrialbaceae archaeon]|nr:hypothetical protein [Natrialbaceae archaeon]